MGYTVLQPVTAIIFTTILLFVGLVAQCNSSNNDNNNNSIESSAQCLNEPGLGTFCGMIGVACGLTLIISTEPRSTSTAEDNNNNIEAESDTEYGSVSLHKNLSDVHRYTEA